MLKQHSESSRKVRDRADEQGVQKYEAMQISQRPISNRPVSHFEVITLLFTEESLSSTGIPPTLMAPAPDMTDYLRNLTVN